jgi:hypothetical protein
MRPVSPKTFALEKEVSLSGMYVVSYTGMEFHAQFINVNKQCHTRAQTFIPRY